ncbi:hypothetical protein C9J44_20955 [Photobacterium sp. GB-27]|uniref:EexN family lipoprotein n=1 Tax=unclassified Photobacterium TaxID=2628852 RepID=UPI000D15D8D5|nr:MULTISPECIES: EexN family lipoprotein [unclassified Photobacterium]PSV30182.1 hypothetical protein C9J44_20955 [Photobacterium sp. GB-27]PSV38639.1 hypothetical protein C9J46_20795 [Photobacterium sp. GB-36]
MNRKFLITAFVATALFGCTEDAKSVDYYANHADETKAKVTECRKDPNAEWDLSTVKTFGDYTVAQSYPAGSGSYVSKMAYVDVGRQILTFEASEATGWLTYDVDGKDVQLIVDNNFISDSQLDENVMNLIKNAHKMSVVVDNKVFDVSTKGSGATMIYLNEFPRWVKQIK